LEWSDGPLALYAGRSLPTDASNPRQIKSQFGGVFFSGRHSAEES